MGFSFLKKKEVSVETEVLIPKTLVLEDNVTQTVNFFKNEEEINYKKTLRVMLESLNLEEIEKVIYYLSIHENKKYSALLEVSHEMISYGSNLEKPFYGFETKIKRDFSERYEEAKNSLSTGDLIALLLRFYFLYNENTDVIIKPVINEVLADVVSCIKENIPLLRAEIENQLYVPISKALFVFFLYDKKEAFNKFKSIIRKDLNNKRTTLPELEYIVTVDRFFDRLNLDYIPKVDTISEKFDLVLADKKSSIGRREVNNEVDKNDFLNIKVPLLGFEKKYLFNNSKIAKPKNTWLVLSTIINVYYEKTFDKKPNINIGDIFIETITNPYPKFSSYELIRTREILKEMFVLNDEFKIMFYLFFDEKKDDRSLDRNSFDAVRTKLPKILGEYFKGEDNFGATTVLKFLYEMNDYPDADLIKVYQSF